MKKAQNLIKSRFATCAFFFMQGIIFSTWTTRIADIRTMLNLTEKDLGRILLGLPLGQFITMAFSGYLVSKFSSKRCILLGSILYPVSLLLIETAQGLWSLFACLVCLGIAANINNIAINTQAVSVQNLNEKSIMGTFHGTWSLGCFCGGWLTMFLINLGIGISQHFLITITYSFLTIAICWKMLLPSDSKKDESPQDAQKTRGMFSPTPFILMLGVTAFGSMSCEGTMFDWSVIYFRDVVKTPNDISNFGYIAFMSMMALGRFLSDFTVQRFGAIRILQASGLIIATGMLLAVIFPHIIPAVLGFFLVGLGVSSVVPICYSATAKSKRMPTGIAIATVCSIGFIGFLLVPPLIGYIAEATNLRVSFAIMACFGLLVSFIAPYLRIRL
ncbi:MAG: MFS transporter [Opitutales bacterium]|nr:MFS transporter [Opitutales bacterium]